MGPKANYCFMGEDLDTTLSEFLRLVEEIEVEGALVFETRNEHPQIFDIYPLNPPEDYPTNMYSYKDGGQKNAGPTVRLSVGEARAELARQGKDAESLEAKIRRELLPVAAVIRGTLEFQNEMEAAVPFYHRLLSERLTDWLEQKVAEKKAYVCGR